MCEFIMVACDLHDRTMVLKIARGREAAETVTLRNTSACRRRLIEQLHEACAGSWRRAGDLRLRGFGPRLRIARRADGSSDCLPRAGADQDCPFDAAAAAQDRRAGCRADSAIVAWPRAGRQSAADGVDSRCPDARRPGTGACSAGCGGKKRDHQGADPEPVETQWLDPTGGSQLRLDEKSVGLAADGDARPAWAQQRGPRWPACCGNGSSCKKKSDGWTRPWRGWPTCRATVLRSPPSSRCKASGC